MTTTAKIYEALKNAEGFMQKYHSFGTSKSVEESRDREKTGSSIEAAKKVFISHISNARRYQTILILLSLLFGLAAGILLGYGAGWREAIATIIRP